MQRDIAAGDFIEHAEFSGNLYGTRWAMLGALPSSSSLRDLEWAAQAGVSMGIEQRVSPWLGPRLGVSFYGLSGQVGQGTQPPRGSGCSHSQASLGHSLLAQPHLCLPGQAAVRTVGHTRAWYAMRTWRTWVS